MTLGKLTPTPWSLVKETEPFVRFFESLEKASDIHNQQGLGFIYK